MAVTATTFDFVRELVHRESAIVLAPGKEYLVEARLIPLVRASGETSVDSFIDRLRSGRDLGFRSQVVEALTTNETSWYRDTDPFGALTSTVAPEILGRPGFDGSLRIWSAACSSGQEAYTIAMELTALTAGRRVRTEILATDLSPAMVERTKAGKYSQLEINRGMPAAKLVSHFSRSGTDWEIDARLRAMVQARVLNLAGPFGAVGTFDVVFLRNVLIYFDVPTKKAILRRVRAVMRPNAYLFLGSAEVTIGVDDGWQRTSVGRCSFYRPMTGA